MNFSPQFLCEPTKGFPRQPRRYPTNLTDRQQRLISSLLREPPTGPAGRRADTGIAWLLHASPCCRVSQTVVNETASGVSCRGHDGASTARGAGQMQALVSVNLGCAGATSSMIPMSTPESYDIAVGPDG